MRKQYANPAIFTLYKEPLMIVEGHMQWLYDETGTALSRHVRRHRHGFLWPLPSRRSSKAMHEQVDTLQHTTTIYLHPELPDCSRRSSRRRCRRGSTSRTSSTAAAKRTISPIQMARLHTGNTDVIALRNAYHGGIAEQRWRSRRTARGSIRSNVRRGECITRSIPIRIAVRSRARRKRSRRRAPRTFAI